MTMKRREFVKSLWGASAAGMALASCASSRPSRRPNVVLILADDMGFSDLGCYGSEISTPNLDRLAAGGLRFTQFYNGARCCPSRAALLTGLYSHQAGMGHMDHDRGLPSYRGFLNERCVTIAEALRAAGYHTWMSGKWHLGRDRPHWPTDRGFDRYYGLISGGSNYFRLDPDRVMAIDDQAYVPDPDGFYLTDAFTDHAVEFIERHDHGTRPFFLYLAYTAPHYPLHALSEDIEKYRGKYMAGWDEIRRRRHERMLDGGLVDSAWPLTPRDRRVPAWEDVTNKETRDLEMSVYAAQIDRMDQGIGKVLESIRRIGAEKETLILFLSDNGGCSSIVDRGTPGYPPGHPESWLSYGIAWANVSNTPFRSYKTWAHEGGIATPLIAYWPGVIRNGGLTHQVGHVIDILPTCLDVAGAAYQNEFDGKPRRSLEGRSLLPVFRGEQTSEARILCTEHEGNRALRSGKWKLVSERPGRWELYDMESDRTELRDLAAAHPSRVERLSSLYANWGKRVGVADWERIRQS